MKNTNIGSFPVGVLPLRASVVCFHQQTCACGYQVNQKMILVNAAAYVLIGYFPLSVCWWETPTKAEILFYQVKGNNSK